MQLNLSLTMLAMYSRRLGGPGLLAASRSEMAGSGAPKSKNLLDSRLSLPLLLPYSLLIADLTEAELALLMSSGYVYPKAFVERAKFAVHLSPLALRWKGSKAVRKLDRTHS